MTPEEIHILVVGTGRLSTAMFILALVGAGMRDRTVWLWLAFVIAQTMHFAVVLWFAAANDGKNLFPGGRSLQDAGGWLTVLGIFTFFYAIALVGLAARQAGPAASRWLRSVDRTVTTLLGLIFLITYVPLLADSMLFVLPLVALTGALGFYLVRIVRPIPGQSP